MRRGTQIRMQALMSAALVLLLATTGWSQSLTWLGTLGGNRSEANGVSADGSVVVGMSYNAADRARAFRWTAAGGMQDLGALDATTGSEALGVSSNGSVVVGNSGARIGNTVIGRAFRWENGTMTDLGTFPAGESIGSSSAYAVSADGSIVVGTAFGIDQSGFWSFASWAFRWQDGVMYDLGVYSSAYPETRAYAISAGGSVIVGVSYFTSGIGVVFRWENGSAQIFRGWVGGAHGISADGSVIVGYRGGFEPPRAVRWKNNQLEFLTDSTGMALGVSADGSIVVGWVESPDDNRLRAFRWTEGQGLEDLNTTYASLLSDGSVLVEARAISPDGRYIAGVGYNADTGRREAFLLDTSFPTRGDINRDGIVDDVDLLRVLLEFGGRGYIAEDINWDGIVDDADLLTVLFNFGSSS